MDFGYSTSLERPDDPVSFQRTFTVHFAVLCDVCIECLFF